MNQEFSQAMHRFIQNIRLRYPNSSTVIHYQSDLEQFNRLVDKAPRAISRIEVTQFVTGQLAAGRSPATVNRRLASLSSFFEFLADEAGDDHWSNPVVWALHRVKQGSHLPRDLPEQVARQFWQVVQQGPVRDQAMVALMLDVGLRVSEVVNLTVDDFEPVTDGEGLASLRVRGKGNKERRVWLVPETAQLIESWLVQRPNVTDEALFITRRGRGFSRRGIQERVKHYARVAKLSSDQVSCHRLRHTFARRMAEARMPLPSLSHWLGHSQLKTTQIYIDGANPDARADYQIAMTALSDTTAVCSNTEEAPAFVLQPSDSPPIPECVADAPLLEAAEIEARLTELPPWLVAPLVDFLLTKQVHWQAQHRRSRAQQWLSELRRAWSWLLEARPMSGLEELSRVDLTAYLDHLYDQELSSHTIKHFLNTFFAFLKFVEAQGMDIAPGLYRVPRPQKADWFPRPLTEAQYQRLEQVVLAQTAQMAGQQAALHSCWFFILGDGGLRISELQALTISDWDAPTQTLHIRYGKGGRERRIPLTSRAAQAIDAHLTSRPEVSLARHKPLVAHQGKAIRPQYVRQVLHAFAQQAGLEEVTPHRLRHTYATRLLNTGKMPVTTLQKLMGHRHLDTTMRYVKLYDQTIRTDYETATAVLQERTEANPDWEVWGTTIESVFNVQEKTETNNFPELGKF
jgi:site-specific recombinase XerD